MNIDNENESFAIAILENTRKLLPENSLYQEIITDAINEVRSLYLAKETLEKQIEVYKLFAPPKKPIDIWRISKDGQEVITNFTSY